MAGPAGSKRAFLHARSDTVQIDAKLGKTTIITAASKDSEKGGYWCETCECQLRDSAAWLSHVNGKRHQRKLGFTMRVEQSTLDDVKGRFASLKRKAEDAPVQPLDYEARLAALEAEEAAAKRAKKDAKDAKRRDEEAEAAAAAEEGIDPEMAAMMGFGGFGTSKK